MKSSAEALLYNPFNDPFLVVPDLLEDAASGETHTLLRCPFISVSFSSLSQTNHFLGLLTYTQATNTHLGMFL